jgi:fatty-acyl-CoA synthase
MQPHSMMDVPLMLSSILDHAADWHGETDIVGRRIDGTVQRGTWAGLRDRAGALGQALVRMGMAPGDRVATLCWNTLDHLELFHAVPCLGGILHTVNPRLSDDHLCYILNHGGARVLVHDAACAGLVARLLPRLEHLRHVVLADDGGAAAVPPEVRADTTTSALIAGAERPAAFPEFDERSGAILCYTSGTTGNPKGVLYTHRSLVLIAIASISKDFFGGYQNGAQDTFMPIAGMFHATGWSFPHTAPISGGRLVLPGRAHDGAALCELIEREGVTIAGAVPTVLMTLRDHLRDTGQRLTTLRSILTSGTPVPAPLIRYWEEEQGVTIVQTWGMTESLCSSRGTLRPGTDRLPPAERLAARSVSGRASWGTRIRIADDDDQVLPSDGTTVGHLQVRGPWSANGYFNDPVSPLTADGWLRTGDMATIDRHGNIRIRDRSKDVIKSGGEWISSTEIEAHAIALPGIRNAAVIAIPHLRWQERPLLIVEPEPGSPPDPAAIMAHLSDRVAKWWLPDRIETIARMPVSATGKILKSELRRMFPQ